jgi:hypothetical protein
LVALGRFQCLVTNGRKRKNIFFTSSHFPPQQILLKPFFFPLINMTLKWHYINMFEKIDSSTIVQHGFWFIWLWLHLVDLFGMVTKWPQQVSTHHATIKPFLMVTKTHFWSPYVSQLKCLCCQPFGDWKILVANLVVNGKGFGHHPTIKPF